jgi:hypothetical protein
MKKSTHTNTFRSADPGLCFITIQEVKRKKRRKSVQRIAKDYAHFQLSAVLESDLIHSVFRSSYIELQDCVQK